MYLKISKSIEIREALKMLVVQSNPIIICILAFFAASFTR